MTTTPTTDDAPTDKPAGKTDLIHCISSDLSHHKPAVVKEIVDAVFATIPRLARQRPYVAIRGFGKFEYRLMQARKAKGGITDKAYEIGERELLKFTVSKDSSSV